MHYIWEHSDSMLIQDYSKSTAMLAAMRLYKGSRIYLLFYNTRLYNEIHVVVLLCYAHTQKTINYECGGWI